MKKLVSKYTKGAHLSLGEVDHWEPFPKFPVRKWNKEEGEGTYRSEITHQEPAGEGSRERILEYERKRADELRKELDPDKHQKP